jgi:hypothetical protein
MKAFIITNVAINNNISIFKRKSRFMIGKGIFKYKISYDKRYYKQCYSNQHINIKLYFIYKKYNLVTLHLFILRYNVLFFLN